MNTNSGQEESNPSAQDWLRRFDKQTTNRLMSLQRHTQNYLHTQRAQDSQPQLEQKIRRKSWSTAQVF